MQLQDILIDTYRYFSKCYKYGCSGGWLFRIWGVKQLWFRLFKALMNITSWISNKVLPLYFKRTKCPCKGNDIDIIVSLTSFPARIEYVWLTVETLKRQSLKPQKILLYLSKEQFPELEKSLPENLKAEQDELFQIVFVDDDLRSHKKYYYAFKDYPEMNVVTFDDDVFYESHTLEELYNAHKRFKDCVICGRACTIAPKREYNSWPRTKEKYVPLNGILQIGISGVLYPPHCYSSLIFDVQAIKECCPKADDIWLNYMCRVKGSKIVMIDGYVDNIPIQIRGDETLYSDNIDENFEQIKSISIWGTSHGLSDYFDA